MNEKILMKTIQSKILLTLIILFFIIGFSTSAKNFIGDNKDFPLDSIPIAAVNTTGNLYLIKNPGRVVYPAVLAEHREESKKYIKDYSKKNRSYIISMFEKGKKYFPKAIRIFDKYDIPYEFQMLPILESNFTAHAVSPVGAVGYWQFMSELAREYGLRVGGKNDERKNFAKSTEAAAKFFRDQLDYFDGDMLLTVAAYNCGPGRVRSSMRKSGVKNPDFWDIKPHLPAETRRFVMNFLSLNVIAANYDKFLNRSLDFEQPHVIQLADMDSVPLPNSASRNSL